MRGPQEIEGQDETDRQHAGHEAAAPVEDLDVAGHRAHPGVLEHGGDDLAHRVRFDDAVRVDGDEELTRALGKAGIEALFLAPVFREADGLDEFGITFLGPLDVSPGVVLGAVIDADNLQPIGRIVGGGCGGNGLFHHGPFVVGRDNDRHPGQAPFGQRIRFIAPPEDGADQLESQVGQGEAGPQGHDGRAEALAAEQLQIAVERADLKGHDETDRQDQRDQDLEHQVQNLNPLLFLGTPFALGPGKGETGGAHMGKTSV